jgi:molybdenum cofactor cytidylyltransferase
MSWLAASPQWMPTNAVAILLAAGESRRMGTPKPLLEWQDTTLIEYQIAQLRGAGCNPVIVVLGNAAEDIRPLAERAGAHVVVNERYTEGRASSLRAGAKAIENADIIVILNVDQPCPTSIVRKLIEEHSSDITLPTHDGHRGHPVVVAGTLLPELRNVDEAAHGLRAVVSRHEVNEIEFDSRIVSLDVNTPEDYEEAKKIFDSEVT